MHVSACGAVASNYIILGDTAVRVIKGLIVEKPGWTDVENYGPHRTEMSLPITTAYSGVQQYVMTFGNENKSRRIRNDMYESEPKDAIKSQRHAVMMTKVVKN